MKLQKSTIDELGIILQEEFGVMLEQKDLEKLAYALIGYFSLLMKGAEREAVRK